MAEHSDMVERVKDAISAQIVLNPYWTVDREQMLERAARAAIEAMREPTRRMLAMGDEAVWEPWSGRTNIGEITLSRAWGVMISAALGEQD